MRISGGAARGIVLKIPRGHDFRPATDRLRQAVFSSLGGRVAGAWFLDLFAGTGSYGLEAFSRGAAGGWFVEQHRGAVAALKANIASVSKSSGRSPRDLAAVCGDALLWTPPPGLKVDLIFVDPPFAQIEALAESLFRRCAGFIRDVPEARLLFQVPGEQELASPGWRFIRRIGKGRGQPTCCVFAPQ